MNFTKEYQEVLIKNGEFDRDELAGFLKKYSNGVMKPDFIEIEDCCRP